ncbi:MAG: hypothetical protein ACLQVL_34590 [Terriglobia bacterium]
MANRKKVRRIGRESKRMISAGKNLKRIEKEIAPYITPRRSEVFSTAGKWRENSSCCSAAF